MKFITENFTNNNAWPNNAQEPSQNAPPPARMLATEIRSRLTQHIREHGINFDLQADNDFTFVRAVSCAVIFIIIFIIDVVTIIH